METLLDRARAGDDAAFRDLTEPHRRELVVHCYRMLGSLQDAEDTVQETLLAAWRGLDGFEARASVRTWLYRIATRRCLNVRRSASRRPAAAWDVPGVVAPEPTRLGEVTWLEPLPDTLLDAPDQPGPDVRYELHESVSLAFVTALQVLPPRQVAVVVLRDVLGFPARETAEMLGTTVDAVGAALSRARSALARSARAEGAPPGSSEERAIAARFAHAYEAADLDALLALLTEDVVVTMPPMPFEYVGRAAAARFFGAIFGSGRRFSLVATRANGRPAFVASAGTGDVREPAGLFTLGLTDDRIGALTRFDTAVLPRFGT